MKQAINGVIKCRTCLENKDIRRCAPIIDKCHPSKTIMEMIILCVPQMASTLSDKDYVCNICLKSIRLCVKFIESCLEVEAKLTKSKEADFISEDIIIKEEFSEDETIIVVCGSPPHDTEEVKEEFDSSPEDPLDDQEDEDQEESIDGRTENSILASILSAPSSSKSKVNSTKRKQMKIPAYGTSPKRKYTRKQSECAIPNKRSKKAVDPLKKKPLRWKDINYRCKFCRTGFVAALDYKHHLRDEHSDIDYRLVPPYCCEKCGAEFTSKEKAITHGKEHGAVCFICLEAFSTKEELKEHEQTHPDKYFCNVCNKGFKKKDSLRGHFEIHIKVYPFQCPECGRPCKTQTLLRYHMTTHTREPTYLCDECPRTFHNPRSFRVHQRLGHGQQHACVHCGKRFQRERNMESHVRLMHLNVKPYQCEVCGMNFGRVDYLKRHTLTHHSGCKVEEGVEVEVKNAAKSRKKYNYKLAFGSKKDTSIPCSICNRVLKNATTLRLHLNTHARIRKFKCEICGLMFMNNQVKDKHMKTHMADPDKKFVCPVCWKKTKTQEELDEHSKRHDLKKYSCEICGEGFARRLLFENHNLQHTDNAEMEERGKRLIAESLLQSARLLK